MPSGYLGYNLAYLIVGAVPGAVHEVPLDDLVVGAAGGVLARVGDPHAAARPHYGAGQVLVHLVGVRLLLLQMRLGMVGMIVAEMRLLLLLEIVLRWRVGPGKVGGGGRVGEVSPAAALGVQGPGWQFNRIRTAPKKGSKRT